MSKPKPAKTDPDVCHSTTFPMASPSYSESSNLRSLQWTSFAAPRNLEQVLSPSLAAENVSGEILTLRRKPCVITWSLLPSHGHNDGDVAPEGAMGGHTKTVAQRQTAILTVQGLACDLLYTGSSRSAIVKLRIPLLSNRRKQPVYITVPGDSILSLTQNKSADSLQDDEDIRQQVTNSLRHASVCLDFSFRSSSILVVPPERIDPADCYEHALLLLHSLAVQTSFSIHICECSIPRNQQHHLQAFIRAGSSPLTTSLDRSQQFGISI